MQSLDATANNVTSHPASSHLAKLCDLAPENGLGSIHPLSTNRGGIIVASGATFKERVAARQ
jgi:hypothetical protein